MRLNVRDFFTKKLPIVLILLAAAAIISQGIYTVQTGQEAVIQRLGKYIGIQSNTGINFKVPFIDTVTIIDVNAVRRMEFGFSTVNPGESSQNLEYTDDIPSAQMLTGDENIAMVETIVQYQINEPDKYIFNVDEPVETIRTVSEAAIRRVIASHTLDEALTDNKSSIQQEIQTDLQAILNKYDMGVRIVGVQLQDVNPPMEVNEAFTDVAGAREDKNSYINEANAYRSEVIPTARGKEATLIKSAEAYATRRVEEAKAAVTAYEQLYAEYVNNPSVTRSRMYLETMQEVLKGVEIYIMSDDGNVRIFNMQGGSPTKSVAEPSPAPNSSAPNK